MRARASRYVWFMVVLLALATAAGCSRGRTDAQIAADVQARIQANAALPNKQITVNANNGVVTLSGAVGSETEREIAANDAAAVEGVRKVVNNLYVAEPAAASTGSSVPSAAPVTRPRAAAPVRAESKPPARVYEDKPQPAASTESAAAVAAPARPVTVSVPEGTVFSVRLIDPLDSATAKPGDSFRATLDAPVVLEDQVVIPQGAEVTGTVVDQASAGRFTGRSALELELTQLSVNGKTYQLNTSHWAKQGSSRGKRTAATVGGGAAIGAIIGGIAGGGKGAAIGAGVGAGAGTGVQAATKGEQVKLASETILQFSLESPVTVTPVSQRIR